MRAILGLAFAVVLACASQAAAAPPPLSAYGALPAIENIAISASGQKLAFIAVSGEKRRLVMQQVTGEPIGVIETGDSKVRDIVWAGDDHLVIITSKTTSMPEYGIPEGEWTIAQSYSLRKKRIINLAGQAPDSLNVVFEGVSLRQVEGQWCAFITTVSLVRPIAQLQRVSLEDGRIEAVEKMPVAEAQGWLIGPDGTPQARTRYDQARGFWSLGVKRGAIWPDVYQVEAPLDSPYVAGFAADGHGVVVGQTTESGMEYVEVTPETGRTRPALPGDHPYEGVLADPVSQKLVGAFYYDGFYRYVFFDPADQKAWDAVARAFKGRQAVLMAWSDDRKRAVVQVEGAGTSGVYYLVDLAAKRADILGETYPGVPDAEVAEMKPYSYKAADGLTIPGYLTLPPGREAKGLPLVVLAHGGPESRDEPVFDWWAQAIASRGYAVLQPNYRGSTGYGQAHVTAGYGQWGRKMQTDLSDGVAALAAQGIVDPKRVCIAGASYGGYAAMAGVTLQQGVYRCAVAVAGISDLRGFLKWRAQRHGRKTEGMRYWRRFMGVEDGDDSVLDEVSPLRRASAAGAPVLLIHGKDDTIVPYRQSADLAEALRKAGRPVEVVTLDGEDHWLSRTRTRQQMLEAAVAFLLRENPPQ